MKHTIYIKDDKGDEFILRWSESEGYVVEGSNSLGAIPIPPKVEAALMAAKELL